MGCRAGITTRPSERKAEWKDKYQSMRAWQLVGPFQNRAAAQAWEDKQACERSPGGDDPDSRGATWYGYRFEF
jgi:hypothetical protein